MTSDAAAESGGDPRDAPFLNAQSLDEALKDGLRSVEAVVEVPYRRFFYAHLPLTFPATTQHPLSSRPESQPRRHEGHGVAGEDSSGLGALPFSW